MANLSEQIAEDSLRRKLLHLLLIQLLCVGLLKLLHRIGLEGQKPAELSSGTADRAAQPRLTKDTPDRTAKWLTDLSEQVAEESLRRELLLLKLLLKLLLQLLRISLLELLHRIRLKG